MTVTFASFTTAYPEFSKQAQPFIESHLASIELVVADHWGPLRDQVVELRLAHRLATLPTGRDARLKGANKQGFNATTYGEEFVNLMRAHSAVNDLKWGSLDDVVPP